MPKTLGLRPTENFPTPLIADVLFYVDVDHSRDKYKTWNYGDPYEDKDAYPDHILVAVAPNEERGKNIFRRFYAADRANQDKYNFEHIKAGLGGQKLEAVTRSYIIRRADYDSTTPALGAAMPDIPVGKFYTTTGNEYVLADRRMQRISERASRGVSTIGQAELDSIYVVEVRVYIDRQTITSSKYDIETNGVLFTKQDIYFRGETYNDGTNPAVNIELALLDQTYWGPTSGGQLREIEQVADDVFIVTTQDLIPQSGLPSGTPTVTGGTIIRKYETKINFGWPAVLGDDGTTDQGGSPVGSSGLEIMSWTDKEGTARNYTRPTYQRNGGNYRCRALIQEEWVTQSELDSADGSLGELDIIDHIFTRGIYYPSPFFMLNIPPCLHGSIFAQADTGTNDPVWGQNVNSKRTYPPTEYTDWPTSLVIDCDVRPWRGGYLVRTVTAYMPR